MSAARRISRGTPYMLNTEEQKALVATLANDPGLQADIETLTHKKFDSLNFGERLIALSTYQEMGHAAATIAQAARAQRDLHNLAQDARGEVSLADRVALLETQLANKDEQLAARADRITLLEQNITALMDQITHLNATPAMAVHSTSGAADH